MKGIAETVVAMTALIAATTWSASLVRAAPDVKSLPLGDGHVSTSPVVGSVWSCQTTFSGGGAFADGPWIKGDGTFDYTAKAVVDGQVSWSRQWTATLSGSTRAITGNALPNHTTGTYPISSTDDAYLYDRNPNRISAQSLSLNLPATPYVASQSSCLPMGQIGVLLTGSPFFNALDALGRDAVAHEVQDACGGHPERSGVYHYHNLSDCLTDAGTDHSALVGYAFDGFGIYGHRGEGGTVLANSDLDACHGHTHTIQWDGQSVSLYHYHATWEYPYTLGCFRGPYGANTTPAGTNTPTPTATPTSTATRATATSTLTPTPMPTATAAPVSCSPRPRVRVDVSRADSTSLRATIGAGAGTLSRIAFGSGRSLVNVSIDVAGGPSGQRSAFTYTPASGASQVTFTARQIVAGQPMMASFLAVDSCGEWPSFVAAGGAL